MRSRKEPHVTSRQKPHFSQGTREMGHPRSFVVRRVAHPLRFLQRVGISRVQGHAILILFLRAALGPGN